jgi:hypothetical protein
MRQEIRSILGAAAAEPAEGESVDPIRLAAARNFTRFKEHIAIVVG